MLWKRWKAFAADIAARKIGIYAANSAFFLVLSLFPALMLLLSLLSFSGLTQDSLLTAISSVTPEAMAPLMSYLVNELYAGSGVALLSVSAVTAVWSSSRGVLSLMEGLNAVYELEDRRNIIIRRLMCLLYTAVLLVTILLITVLCVYGGYILDWLDGSPLPVLRPLLFLLRLRWLLVAVFLMVVFVMLYKLFPAKKLRIRTVLPGAAFSAAGWLIFTQLYSVYLRTFGSSYAMTYGSLATIAISMLWLYFCLCILFFGAVLNRYLAEDRKTLRGLFRRK